MPVFREIGSLDLCSIREAEGFPTDSQELEFTILHPQPSYEALIGIDMYPGVLMVEAPSLFKATYAAGSSFIFRGFMEVGKRIIGHTALGLFQLLFISDIYLLKLL